MKELKFKTNINCQNCVNTVTPFITKIQGINKWHVDTNNPNKILTVESSGATEEEIINAVKKSGFSIEKD